MKIKLKATYKSLEPFESEYLPNFCVITGKNGSGKTQLVELIQTRVANSNDNFELDVDRLKIQMEGINNPTSNYLDPSLSNQKISEFHSQYTSYIHFAKTFEVLFHKVPKLSLYKLSREEFNQLIIDFASEEVRIALDSVKTFDHPQNVGIGNYANHMVEQIYPIRQSFDIAQTVSIRAQKSIRDLNQQDFMRFPPDEKYLDRQHLFYSSIERIFYGYARRRHNNFMHLFTNEKFGKKYSCISDEEFVAQFPPPWLIANSILEKHGLNYRFQEILPDEFVEHLAVEFKLIKKSNNKKIDFAHLSSGEKIIVGLIVKLFTTEYYKKTLELPELIVLDEPDAHLHPQLAKLLIDVLNDTFVNELGIKVIVTTHSPSTVAMTPDDSIFELKNENETSLKKTTKDDALKILTFGVPTLSIDFRNHRQVFVESPTDVFYYQSIYSSLSQHEKLIFKPYFVSYGKVKGNCDQVIELVKNLRSAGNNKVYGIVDWDGSRESNGFTSVHGYKTTYSIENFVYAPIYLAAYFLEIGGAENIVTELGFDTTYNQYAFGGEQNERLQTINDWIISKYVSKFKAQETSNNTPVQTTYLNGSVINVPRWYLQMKGHELEKKLKQVFPSLEGKFRNEGQMQEQLTTIIAKSYPLVPIETVNLLRQLTN